MFKLRKRMCETCIYGPNTILAPGRLEWYKREWKRRDTHHICHKEAVAGQTTRSDEVCCRGFYDANPGLGNLRRIAERLGAVDLVD